MSLIVPLLVDDSSDLAKDNIDHDGTNDARGGSDDPARVEVIVTEANEATGRIDAALEAELYALTIKELRGIIYLTRWLVYFATELTQLRWRSESFGLWR